MDGTNGWRWIGAVLVVAAVACGDDGGDEGVAMDGRADGPGSVFGGADVIDASVPPETDAAARASGPRRIYYDLTAYDWYRHGEPLRLGGGEYVPDGTPQAIPAGRMRRVATYAGVDVYVPDDAQPPYDVVFVPVFGRYWQPFVLQARVPTRAD